MMRISVAVLLLAAGASAVIAGQAAGPETGAGTKARAPASKTASQAGNQQSRTERSATEVQPAAVAKPTQPPVAVIGVLDKRQGTTAEFTLKPGERFQFERLSGILRTCEHTRPYEVAQSAAFVQVIDQPPTLRGRPSVKPVVAFSGWLFAESPSLNPFQHPVYDVWLKSCTMHFPEGPPTVAKTRSRRVRRAAPAESATAVAATQTPSAAASPPAAPPAAPPQP